MKSGVPQGSVLGPLFFIIFINDLPDIINDCNVLTFADDTKITSKISSERDVINLQENLNKTIKWSLENNMELNPSKFEYICHNLNTDNSHQKLLKELPFPKNNSYIASNISIFPSNNVRDLGVLIDNKLDWTVHLHSITMKAKQICGWILSVFFSRDKETMLTLFNSLVKSKLEYCCSIWNPHLIKDINQIEQVQRSFTSRIKNMQDLDYWDRLKSLNIMSLQRRREFNTLLHLWKIGNGQYPNSIDLEFKHKLRSNSIEAIVNFTKSKGKSINNLRRKFYSQRGKVMEHLACSINSYFILFFI